MTNLSTTIDCQCDHQIPLDLNMGPRERRQVLIKCPDCQRRYRISAKSEVVFRLHVDSIEPLQEESKVDYGVA